MSAAQDEALDAAVEAPTTDEQQQAEDAAAPQEEDQEEQDQDQAQDLPDDAVDGAVGDQEDGEEAEDAEPDEAEPEEAEPEAEEQESDPQQEAAEPEQPVETDPEQGTNDEQEVNESQQAFADAYDDSSRYQQQQQQEQLQADEQQQQQEEQDYPHHEQQQQQDEYDQGQAEEETDDPFQESFAVHASLRESESASFQPPERSRAFDAADARAFLELPLSQALQLVVARYREICGDFGQAPSAFLAAAVGGVAFGGHALLLSGATASPSRESPDARLDDATLYPLLEVLAYGFASAPIATIDLSFNHLGRSTAQGLAALLDATRTLTSLDLSGNDLDAASGVALADAILVRPGVLTRLNLHTNPIGPQAVSRFAEVLSSPHSTLTDLNLGNTDCDTLALMKVSTALRTNRTLKRLNLDSPLLFSHQEETTSHLARSLALNRSLLGLSLKGHRMRDDGVQWLATHLAPNGQLVELNLARNGISTTGVARLARVLAHRPCEAVVNLDGNLLTGQTFDEIREAIDEARETRAPNVLVFNSRQDRHSLRAKATL